MQQMGELYYYTVVMHSCTGGKVLAETAGGVPTNGVAIRNAANGYISISGANTLIISAAFGNAASNNPATIFLQSGSGNLTVSDGATVQNTRDITPIRAIFQHADHDGTADTELTSKSEFFRCVRCSFVRSVRGNFE